MLVLPVTASELFLFLGRGASSVLPHPPLSSCLSRRLGPVAHIAGLQCAYILASEALGSLRRRLTGIGARTHRASACCEAGMRFISQYSSNWLTCAQTFVEEWFTLPSPMPIPTDMVPRISRLAQAYLENISASPGTVSRLICVVLSNVTVSTGSNMRKK